MNHITDDNFKIVVNKLKALSKVEFNSLVEIVNNIINYNITDERLIEHTLDRLLNLYFIDETIMRPVYIKLINYYHRINPDASDDYLMYYFEDFELDDNNDNLTRKITKDK